MGGGVLWQGELGCGEGKRTEDGRVWQEVKSRASDCVG